MPKSVEKTTGKKHNTRWLLLIYDIFLFLLASLFMLAVYDGGKLVGLTVATEIFVGGFCVFFWRFLLGVYRQIWRYGGVRAYLRLFFADGAAFLCYYGLDRLFGAIFAKKYIPIPFDRMLVIVCVSLLLALAMRMIYQGLYRFSGRPGKANAVTRGLLNVFGNTAISADEAATEAQEARKIKIAIVGAGSVGVGLAEDLANNPRASYKPVCFVDINREKIGRRISDLPVYAEEDVTAEAMASLGVQEIVFALPQMDTEKKKALFERYKQTGCRVKVYDFPTMQTSGKRTMREFDIEELLFRKPVEFSDEKTAAYYRGKTVLITGGGGSIGSELCRQIAKMQPKKLIVLDVYENGAYDVQQELKIAYRDALDLRVEIVSVCDRKGLEVIFARYRPQLVLHAAAHKHVPLMEHNCCEAVKNNVFGTLNVVELSEKYGVERFIMVSTDKAVNPTNVMGATKRMCEMIVQSHSQSGTKTTYSATRFGNVLGSAGSVIPLFRRQIANGGPVTLTDNRIIRYFMTIPEASQLVLQSGAMAKNGELFVLDMGKPVKILDLAENMIRLSGFEPYRDIDILETGLRPGEKLYEELLIKTEELDRTESDLIFVERDEPLPLDELNKRLVGLHNAVKTEDDDAVRAALHAAVPTFRAPEAVNPVEPEKDRAGSARKLGQKEAPKPAKKPAEATAVRIG